MGAALRCVEVRALDMDSGDAVIAALASFPHGVCGRLLYFRGVAQYGRQHGGGAQGAVSQLHLLDSFQAGRIVQHDVATAIDLQVNKSRGECALVQRLDYQPCGTFRLRQDLLDSRSPQDHAMVVQELFAVEYCGCRDCKRVAVVGHGLASCCPV